MCYILWGHYGLNPILEGYVQMQLFAAQVYVNPKTNDFARMHPLHHGGGGRSEIKVIKVACGRKDVGCTQHCLSGTAED